MANLKGNINVIKGRLEKFEGDPDEMYKIHKKSKSNGGTRIIEEPAPSLKKLQKHISERFLQSIRPHKCAVGFIKGNSVVDAAKRHCGYPLVIRLDIKSFFHNTTRDMINKKFRRYYRRNTIASFREDDLYNKLLDVLTKDGRLAMGAPSSPTTTNIVCKSLDAALNTIMENFEEEEIVEINGEKMKKNTYNYTRYADDMIFSTTDKKNGTDIIPTIKGIIESHDYKVNEDKTLVMRDNQRQTVLGMTVNKKPNIPRNERKEFRARLHNLKTKLQNGETPIDEETGEVINARVVNQIAGTIAHAQSINETYSERWEDELEEIKELAQSQNYI